MLITKHTILFHPQGPEQHAGVYLFADGHNKRVDYKLILFNQDPRKDKNHSVNDWTAEYKVCIASPPFNVIRML